MGRKQSVCAHIPTTASAFQSHKHHAWQLGSQTSRAAERLPRSEPGAVVTAAGAGRSASKVGDLPCASQLLHSSSQQALSKAFELVY